MRYLPVLMVLMVLSVGSRVATAGIDEIWATHDGRKIRPTDVGPSSRQDVVKLFGMRNETIALQLVVRADASGADNVQISVLGLGASGTVAPRIEMFREDYAEIRERSHDLFWKPGSSAEPANFLGRIPDRLVPLPYGEENGGNEIGVDISPSENQTFWIDIWVPPGMPAGLHTGTLQVTADGPCSAGCQLKVELELLDTTMPEISQIRTMLWFSGGEQEDKYINDRYFSDPQSATEADKRQLRLRHYQLARQHRVSLFWEYHETQSEELETLLSGRAFSSEAGYIGPGQGRGQDLLVVRSHNGTMPPALGARWALLAQKYPDVLDTFFYTMDEPEEGDYPEVNRRAKSAGPLQTFVTTRYSPKLDVDVFAAPAGDFARKDALAAHDAGKTMWIYNGSRPYSGSFAIDDVAISPRVNSWIQYRENISRWFYWESTYYLDFQGKRGAVDVGREAMNFTNRHGDGLNGDGLLMYPGTDFLFPESDLGIDGPVASIRLKNWRRGIEDVEYLVLARAAGLDAEVDALLAVLLPKTLDSVSESGFVSWPEDGDRWLLARRYLFELLRDGRSEIDLATLQRPEDPEEHAGMKFLPLVLGGLFAAAAALLFQRWQRQNRAR